ncbi:30S ribosomal protein S9 [Candidatus Pacearchaeota archaeon]|nr:30S ribosomal protein S9 [Candidatus Pacearchaeota archaeon]
MKLTTSGKRKRAIAKAVISEGSGKISINKRNHKTLHFFDRLKIEEPIRIFENVIGKPNFDVVITVAGGGRNGQIEASRLALARAIRKERDVQAGGQQG